MQGKLRSCLQEALPLGRNRWPAWPRSRSAPLTLALMMVAARGAAVPGPRVGLPSDGVGVGRVETGQVATARIPIRNDGERTLRLFGVRCPPGGRVAAMPATIEPGKSAEIVVELDTTGYHGVFRTTWLLSCNTLRTAQLLVGGSSEAPVSVEPGEPVFVGGRGPRTLTYHVSSQGADRVVTDVLSAPDGVSVEIGPPTNGAQDVVVVLPAILAVTGGDARVRLASPVAGEPVVELLLACPSTTLLQEGAFVWAPWTAIRDVSIRDFWVSGHSSAFSVDGMTCACAVAAARTGFLRLVAGDASTLSR